MKKRIKQVIKTAEQNRSSSFEWIISNYFSLKLASTKNPTNKETLNSDCERKTHCTMWSPFLIHGWSSSSPPTFILISTYLKTFFLYFSLSFFLSLSFSLFLSLSLSLFLSFTHSASCTLKNEITSKYCKKKAKDRTVHAINDIRDFHLFVIFFWKSVC